MEKEGYSVLGIVGAFAAGAAAGGVTALLLAPHSGAQTRAKLKVVPHAAKTAYTQALQAGREAFTQNYLHAGGSGGGSGASKHH